MLHHEHEGYTTMRALGILTAFALLVSFAAAAEDGCSKDTDCKGQRICVQKECVDPSAPAPSSASGPIPASFQPAPLTPGQPPGTSSAAALDTRHRHLGGFVRPDLGFGYVYMSASSNGTDASIKGLAGSFGVAAGGALSENSILAFHFWDVVATNPTVTVGGFAPSNADATLTIIAFGPEYTRYFGDNLYFSITPSLSRATLSTGGNSSDTNWGFGLRAGLGKEWWVSDHWALGAVGHLTFSANQDSGSNPPTWTGWGGTVAFSATYN
jgi:hypothetical protein